MSIPLIPREPVLNYDMYLPHSHRIYQYFTIFYCAPCHVSDQYLPSHHSKRPIAGANVHVM